MDGPIQLDELVRDLQACRICAARFAGTASAHQPRPVAWVDARARILIAGQAPGIRVHQSGRPFTDPSGDRLRDWLGVDKATFYDRSRFAILPMAFCFPGHDAKGGDLPPPPVCARTWRARLLGCLPNLRLTLAVGGPAQKWHLGPGPGVDARVRAWRQAPPGVIPLPHPSWRNNAWLARNPWFAGELLPFLRQSVQDALHD